MRAKTPKVEIVKTYANNLVFFNEKNFNSHSFVKSKKPLVVEFAMGRGKFITELAGLFPEKNFIGIEVKTDRIYSGIKHVEMGDLTNCIFINIDIKDVELFFTKRKIDELWINFPDPWPKKKHTKRRLISENFHKLYKNIISKDAKINLKTDSDMLFEFTKEVLENINAKILIETKDLYETDFPIKIISEYEGKFLKQGKTTNFLQWKYK